MTARGAGFRTPPEILEFHLGREIWPTFTRFDLTAHERAHVFSAAKATDRALLVLLQASIAVALEKGWGFETWQRALVPNLADIGWTIPQVVRDPFGLRPEKSVDLIDPKRLASLFWGHMGAARAAGQWVRAQRTGRAFPYVLYVGPAPVHPPGDHGCWAGLILPLDDAWWNTHWPPNGWGCTCSVMMITDRERDRLLAEEPRPGFPCYHVEPRAVGAVSLFINERTGRSCELPAGVEFGWDGNPGRDQARPLHPMPRSLAFLV